MIAALALAGATRLCHAQPVITFNNDSSQSSAFNDGDPTANNSYTWIPTNGPNGGGCIMGVMDGTNTLQLLPDFDVSFNSAQYFQVTFQMRVDPSSGTTGNLGSGGYGNLQMALRDSSYSFVGVGYATIFPPGANNWVTYTYAIPSPGFNVAHLQFQLQGGSTYSGTVTIYIGDVTIIPIPDPAILSYFTNDVVSPNWANYGLSASWDSSQDAPYFNAVTGAGPINVTPPGSVEFQATTETGYPGGQLNLGFNASKFQSVAFDLYYDGPTPNTSTNYGGFQVFIANNLPPNYPWAFIGSASFNASMIGKWTHFNLPCASTGVTNANGLSFQATPGNEGGTDGSDPITFHVDNIQLWNPVFLPSITGPLPGTPGGVQLTLDADGSANIYDQEGISDTNNPGTDFFWINQTPVTYSFTLTNFPKPLAAPQFDAHIYLWNGDSETALSGSGGYGYNVTYSGVPYNVPDYFGFHVQNGTNGGVVALVDWKTNLPNANAFTNISFNYPSMASGNGTWTLNFSDNTHGSIVAPDSSVNNFTLPDFVNDPNYTGNFTPGTSVIQVGVFKDGNVTNNSQTATVSQVLVTNGISGTLLSEGFSGPGLTANYPWQVCTYYLDSANRAVWQPFGTGYWLKWNATTGGWKVQSTAGLPSGWTNAGVSYTYTDTTGTNTWGAIPTTNLPAGNAAFFRLSK